MLLQTCNDPALAWLYVLTKFSCIGLAGFRKFLGLFSGLRNLILLLSNKSVITQLTSPAHAG
jgi:hypothetical protein